MKRLYLLVAVMLTAVVACSCKAYGQSTPKSWGWAGTYDLKTHKGAAYVLAPPIKSFDLASLFTNVPDINAPHFMLDIAPFAGSGDTGNGLLGIQATHAFALTKDHKWNLDFGLYGHVENHRPSVGGLILGITVDLGH